MGTLHKDLCTFMILSRCIILKMTNVSDKSCLENQSTHFVFNNVFSENYAVSEIMWKNVVEPDRPHITIRPMRFACWITKATDTQS